MRTAKPTLAKSLTFPGHGFYYAATERSEEDKQRWKALAILTKATIQDKIFGTKWSNPVKLDRNRKVWYLFLRAF